MQEIKIKYRQNKIQNKVQKLMKDYKKIKVHLKVCKKPFLKRSSLHGCK